MILHASGLTVAHGRRVVLRDVSLAVAPGEIRALIGPNGSGKSTALSALAGLIAPQAGEVLLEGQPIRAMTRPPTWRGRRGISIRRRRGWWRSAGCRARARARSRARSRR